MSIYKSRKRNPQKLTQLSSRSYPRHLVRKRTAQEDTIIDITSDSQVNSNFPYRWSPASLTISEIDHLYDNAISAVQANGSIREWLRITVGVRQGRLLSSTLFKIFSRTDHV